MIHTTSKYDKKQLNQLFNCTLIYNYNILTSIILYYFIFHFMYDIHRQ
jgi:hypothetical protein